MDGVSESDDKDIISTALKRFERAWGYWSDVREAAREDMKFLLGDADNNWQWPDWAAAQRRDDKRPMLTINRVPQHVSQVTNEIRQNPPQAKVRPVDDDADPDTAEVFSGLVRHVWNNTDSTFAICNASEWQVGGGYGYFRILADYMHDGGIDQDLYIKQIADPLLVVDDPAIQTPTGSDRRFLFIVEDMPRAEFREEYPEAEEVDFSIAGQSVASWWQEETVRVAEYYVVKTKSTKIHRYADGRVQSDPHPFGLPAVESRDIERPYVCWYKITATEVLESREYDLPWIPVVRAVGVEKIIDGKRVIKGMVRNAKDAQRMYNFWATAYTERVALVPKAPFVGPAGFAEGYEDKWRSAATKNHAYLEYNAVLDENGNTLPPPVRQPGADVPTGLLQGMLQAADDLKAVTGQYDASLGARSNETSGKAIMARQREGDVGTYHFIDNLAKAVEFAGRIIVAWAPKVYDVRRVARIIGEDGSEDFAQIDPEQPVAMRKVRDEETGEIRSIYNLGVGHYDIVVSTGPTYTTKRQEAAELMTTLAQSDPTLMQRAGDIIVRNFDIPGAEELSKRLKLMLPPEIRTAEEAEEKGEPQMPPQIMAAVQQIEQANQMLDAKAQELAQMQAQIESEKGEVDGKRAELQAAAERVRAEMRELDLRKQLAIKEVELAGARLQADKVAARGEIEEYVESMTGAPVEGESPYGSA